MPSTIQAGGKVSYRPHPNLVRDYGENPARFLSMSEPHTALAIIRGIQSTGRANAWKAIELREFGGRDVILEAIGKRLTELGGDG